MFAWWTKWMIKIIIFIPFLNTWWLFFLYHLFHVMYVSKKGQRYWIFLCLSVTWPGNFQHCISQYYTSIIRVRDLKRFCFVYTKSTEQLIRLSIIYCWRKTLMKFILTPRTLAKRKKIEFKNLSRDTIIHFKKITTSLWTGWLGIIEHEKSTDNTRTNSLDQSPC